MIEEPRFIHLYGSDLFSPDNFSYTFQQFFQIIPVIHSIICKIPVIRFAPEVRIHDAQHQEYIYIKSINMNFMLSDLTCHAFLYLYHIHTHISSTVIILFIQFSMIQKCLTYSNIIFSMIILVVRHPRVMLDIKELNLQLPNACLIFL